MELAYGNCLNFSQPLGPIIHRVIKASPSPPYSNLLSLILHCHTPKNKIPLYSTFLHRSLLKPYSYFHFLNNNRALLYQVNNNTSFSLLNLPPQLILQPTTPVHTTHCQLTNTHLLTTHPSILSWINPNIQYKLIKNPSERKHLLPPGKIPPLHMYHNLVKQKPPLLSSTLNTLYHTTPEKWLTTLHSMPLRNKIKEFGYLLANNLLPKQTILTIKPVWGLF